MLGGLCCHDPTGFGQAWSPFGIAIDSTGDIYVSDMANDVIHKLIPNRP